MKRTRGTGLSAWLSVARRSVLGIFMAVALSCLSCNFGHDLKATVTLQTKIKSDLGVDANVNFRTVNGITNVTVVLATLPAGDPKVTKAKVEKLARAEFPGAAAIVIMATL